MDIKAKTLGVWTMLAKATGYSKVYCRKVVTGNRSQESKGGKIIMAKYQELIETLDHYYSEDTDTTK